MKFFGDINKQVKFHYENPIGILSLLFIRLQSLGRVKIIQIGNSRGYNYCRISENRANDYMNKVNVKVKVYYSYFIIIVEYIYFKQI